MNTQDEEMFASVLANEATARIFLDQLIARGVKINLKQSELSHEEVIDICLVILTDLRLREQK